MTSKINYEAAPAFLNQSNQSPQLQRPSSLFICCYWKRISQLCTLWWPHKETKGAFKCCQITQVLTRTHHANSTRPHYSKINRLVWHYSSGTYRSVNVCGVLRQSRSNVRGPRRLSLWPWFARINWKNYHSIISICATSLCKGEREPGQNQIKYICRNGGKRTWPGTALRVLH